MSKRSTIKRNEYPDTDAYHRAVREAGGPRLEELNELGRGTGENADLHRAIWGASEAEFLAALKYEDDKKQREQPHLFVKKRKARR